LRRRIDGLQRRLNKLESHAPRNRAEHQEAA
jgi:hypothetical protein